MNVRVTSLLMSSLESALREAVRESVSKCAEEYGFDYSSAIEMLELGTASVRVVAMKKRSSGKKEVKALKGSSEVKAAFPVPFVSSMAKESGCGGLCYNRGLFTQCLKAKMESGWYCKTCQKEADGSANGKPLLGTVTDRMNSELMGYRDPKGRSPVAYSRIMSQLGLSRSTVELEAERLGVVIPEEHFAPEVKEPKRGRPKTEKKKAESVETTEDLFAKLLSDSNSEVDSNADTVLMSDDEESSAEFTDIFGDDEVDAQSATLKAEKEAEAAALKAEKEAAVAALKAEKEAAAAALKVEKEAKAAALKEEKEAKAAALKEEKEAKQSAQGALKAEKEAAAAALKAEKEAAAAALKAEKDAAAAAVKAEKEAKVAAAKAEKGAKQPKEAVAKAPKKSKGGEKEVPKKPEVAAEPPRKVTVTRITIDGTEYLKSGENILYNPKTKAEMGIYDPETKTIQPLPDESDDELDAEDYESDDAN
jgi:hypothetical protein